MWNVAIVSAAGAAGALARYLIGLAVVRLFGERIGWATLLVNVAGCLAVGVVMHLFTQRHALGEAARLAIVVGFLGAFTTYSAFGYETFVLARERGPLAAGGYAALMLALAAAAVWIGWHASALASPPSH